MSIAITNVDLGNVVFQGAEFRDELLTFAAAGTVVEGTILARLTATQNLTPFVVGGAGGAEIPTHVVTYDVVATGAGDVGVRALISGKVRKESLIVDADGTGANITTAHLESLRGLSIIAINVSELNIQDNQ